jgi:hypothetical protein
MNYISDLFWPWKCYILIFFSCYCNVTRVFFVLVSFLSAACSHFSFRAVVLQGGLVVCAANWCSFPAMS